MSSVSELQERLDVIINEVASATSGTGPTKRQAALADLLAAAEAERLIDRQKVESALVKACANSHFLPEAHRAPDQKVVTGTIGLPTPPGGSRSTVRPQMAKVGWTMQ